MTDAGFQLENDNKHIEISMEHFLKVQEMARLGSWRMDLNDRIIVATEEAAKIYGFSNTTGTIDTIRAQALPVDQGRLERELKQLISGESTYDIVYRIKRRNDDEIRIIHSVAEYNPEENTVTGVFQDITEQKILEQQLAYSEERFRSLFDNSVSGLLLIDPDGSIIEINKKMLALLGSPSEKETKNINIFNFKPLVDVGFSDDVHKAFKSGELVTNSYKYTSKWGATLYLEYYLTPIRQNNLVTGVMAKIEDITKRKEAEAEVESLLKEKDLILREVHHRIKNNMSSIEGLLMLQVEHSGDDNVKSELKEAVSRLRSMRVLYEKLYQSEDFISTSFKAYMEKLVDDIAGVFPERSNIIIKKELDDFPVPSEIMFSLGIIINELLTNALKYAFNENTGENIINISARKKASIVTLTVSDNGAGYTDPGKERSGGFGLKLITMLSKQISGSCEFHNDKGAVFSLSFNVEEA